MSFEFVAFAGQSYVKRLYGGIGIHGKKGRSEFHVAVTNVATEINSVEQVCLLFFTFSSLVSLRILNYDLIMVLSIGQIWSQPV